MSNNSKISVGAAVIAALCTAITGFFVFLQYGTAENQRQHFKDQIKYIAVLERKDTNDQFGTLKLQQVSGQRYILTGIWLWPSIENNFGEYVAAEPFALGIIEYLQLQNSLPRYEIPGIGQLICHKRPKFGDLTCDPSDTFRINYRYNVFDDKRRYTQALLGRLSQ